MKIPYKFLVRMNYINKTSENNNKFNDFLKRFRHIKPSNSFIALIIVLSAILISCEDLPPHDYSPKVYVEAYLFVDHNIEKIKILKTQPVDSLFNTKSAFIKDADVKIINTAENRTYNLVMNEDDKSYGYWLPDTSVKIQPETLYLLEIRLKDGKHLTSQTQTPPRIYWIKVPKDTLYFPKDTLKLPSPDSLYISWSKTPNTKFYFLSTVPYDTLEYGKYLNPQDTSEKNRRSYNFFSKHEQMYKEPVFTTFMDMTESPTVWMAFKWFGKHKVIIYNPDNNYSEWVKQALFFSQNGFDPLLSSIKGEGIGVFGSASRIEKDVFVKKNQR